MVETWTRDSGLQVWLRSPSGPQCSFPQRCRIRAGKSRYCVLLLLLQLPAAHCSWLAHLWVHASRNLRIDLSASSFRHFTCSGFVSGVCRQNQEQPRASPLRCSQYMSCCGKEMKRKNVAPGCQCVALANVLEDSERARERRHFVGVGLWRKVGRQHPGDVIDVGIILAAATLSPKSLFDGNRFGRGWEANIARTSVASATGCLRGFVSSGLPLSHCRGLSWSGTGDYT